MALASIGQLRANSRRSARVARSATSLYGYSSCCMANPPWSHDNGPAEPRAHDAVATHGSGTAATVLTILASCDYYNTSQYFNFGNVSGSHSGYQGLYLSHVADPPHVRWPWSIPDGWA